MTEQITCRVLTGPTASGKTELGVRLAKAEGWYRHQIVLRAPAAKDLAAAVKWIRAARPVPDGLRLSFDVDALNLL